MIPTKKEILTGTIYRQRISPDGDIVSLSYCSRSPTECCCYYPELVDSCEVLYREGKLPPRYPVPAIYHDYYIQPLVRGYWWLYWYRMGFSPTRWPERFRPLFSIFASVEEAVKSE